MHVFNFIDDEFGEKTVSVLLDGEESEIVFIDHPSSEMSVSFFQGNPNDNEQNCIQYTDWPRPIHLENYFSFKSSFFSSSILFYLSLFLFLFITIIIGCGSFWISFISYLLQQINNHQPISATSNYISV